MPSELSHRRILQLLQEAIQRDIHFIARHAGDYPQGLFQCLWNSCWWYDCPEAARHYEESDGPWSRPGPKLYELLETWRATREKIYAGFYWVRSLRPPPTHLGTSQRAVLRGHVGRVNTVPFSPDGGRIVSGSEDGTVRVWDTESGAEIRCLRGHEAPVLCITITDDSRIIVSGCDYNTVRVWDAESGEQLRCFRGHEGPVNSVVVSFDGHRIASGSNDNTVRVWDAGGDEELRCL